MYTQMAKRLYEMADVWRLIWDMAAPSKVPPWRSSGYEGRDKNFRRDQRSTVINGEVFEAELGI